MECELVAGAHDLVYTKPSELDLQIHTVYLGDGPRMDYSTKGTSEMKLVLLATEGDGEVALSWEGNLYFAVGFEIIRVNSLRGETTW